MLDTKMRVQAYISLSSLLQHPDEELLKLIGSSDFQELWRQVEASYKIEFPKSWKIETLPDLKEWDRMWNITMGPVKPLAEPIESLHKVWTTDQSCELPIANQKGYLMGDWAHHMQELLVESGFEIPPQFAHCPDHLILELEFASLLVEGASAETLTDFAEHHFDWLEDLHETAKNKNVPEIYQDLYKLCSQYVKADVGSLL